MFFASLLIIPFLILIVVEGGLRVFGYGQSYRLWQKQGDDYVINPKFPQLFFSQNDISIPEFIQQKIPLKKSANEVRVVCLGGSTTEGFPFEEDINFPHFLQCYLRQADSTKNWQVINLGLSAINSHSVRFMLPEILQIKPDLILIYMGHNEFYGALGLASNSFLGSNPTLVQGMLHLKRLRLYQLLENIIHLFWSKKKQEPKTLMAAMIKKSRIAPNDPIYRKTIQNFKVNLGKIASRFAQQGIPVLVSTLVSNLKDQQPLGYPDPKTSIPQYTQIRQLMEQRQWSQALPLLKAGLQTAGENPLTHYLLGQCYYRLQNFTLAKNHFVLARDFDRLPFRAPSEINAVIRGLCQQGPALLVPTDLLFAAHSPHGITDSTLFLEHLHPNEKGYELLAQSFFRSIIRANLLARTFDTLSFKMCHRFTPLDIAIGEIKIADLVSHPPFNGRTHFKPRKFEPSLVHQLAYEHVFGALYWDAAHFKLGDWFAKHGQFRKALTEYFAVLQSDANHISALYKIGDVYLKSGEFNQAINYYRRAEKVNPRAAFVKAKLARALLLNGNVQQALGVINALLGNKNQSAQFNARQLEALKQLRALAVKRRKISR